MTDHHDTTWLTDLATALDWLLSIPAGALSKTVSRRGACMQVHGDEPPTWLFNAKSDREFAARLCADCPVPGECLELELRTFGGESAGVWGALGEDDRRALFPLWADRSDPNGGETR